MPTYDKPGAVRRFQGETFASFAARQYASQITPILEGRGQLDRAPKATLNATGPFVAMPDGDDLGESPDY